MYPLFMLTVGFAMSAIGLTHADSSSLWGVFLILGGVFIGHAITEALNTPLNDSDDSSPV